MEETPQHNKKEWLLYVTYNLKKNQILISVRILPAPRNSGYVVLKVTVPVLVAINYASWEWKKTKEKGEQRRSERKTITKRAVRHKTYT
jgi:membrane-anchored protein YejM (alkaline phosphatase superfamily)